MVKPLLFILLCSIFSSSAYAEESSREFVQQLWQNLTETENQCPDEFDYYPNGGLRIFYCHAKTYLPYAQLKVLAGTPVFLTGPHSSTKLNMYAMDNFGHYNPEFVTWLHTTFIPTAEDKDFKEATESIFNTHVRGLAHAYYVTHIHLFKDKAFMEQELEKYKKLIEIGDIPEFYSDTYFSFANLDNEGMNGNIVKNAVLFWLRRVMDGTEAEFFTALVKLLTIYDAEFLEEKTCQYPDSEQVAFQCAEKAYKKADDALNKSYKKLIKQLDDSQHLPLKTAQRAWIAFRDSNAIFLATNYQGIQHRETALLHVKTEMTNNRVSELNGLLIEATPTDD